MDIALVYDLRDDYLAEGYSTLDVAEFDSPETIAQLEAALGRLGHRVTRIGHGRALAARLVAGERFDLVFSIAEGLKGRSREAQVPALCELFAQAYAFSDPLTMAATLDKAVAKRIVRDLAIPTADFAVIAAPEDARGVDLPFPLFVKPVAEGTGKGCANASRVRDPHELETVSRRLIAEFAQPAIAEVYLSGREFTVGIVGTGKSARVIGVAEITIRPDAGDPVYSYENKEACEDNVVYALAADPEAMCAAHAALSAYRALDCRDAARLDFRSDAFGNPHFLEANPIAGLHPTHSDLPIIAGLSGLGFDGLISAIVDSARQRKEAMASLTREVA